MENTIRTDEAIRLINYAFDLNIEARGDLKEYFNILQILKLEDPFSKEDLIQKIIQYKTRKFQWDINLLEDRLREL